MDIAKPSVLIVDADVRAQQATRSLLQYQNQIGVCCLAGSGYEAIVKHLKQPADVVLMEVDLETPMAGMFILREIASAPDHAPVIIYTNHREPDIIYRAFSYGADNYVFKEASPTKLIRAIVAANASRNTISPEVTPLMLKEFRRLRSLEDNMSYLLKTMLSLTPTELDILRLLYGGAQAREVSRVRFIELTTTKTHISHILRKFNLNNMSQVIELLRESGFFSMLE